MRHEWNIYIYASREHGEPVCTLCIFVQCQCSARDGYVLMLSWRVSLVAFRAAIKKLWTFFGPFGGDHF